MSVAKYQTVQVMTADKVSLIIMLYDGILRFNKLAQMAIGNNDIGGRGRYLNRSLAIIGELTTALDGDEGGEIAANLARLYEFCTIAITEANLRNDASRIEPVNRVISELKAGWEAISTERQKQERAEPRSLSCGA
ncbi:MAG: flagellar export chaperone FliS [Deltaproteobacteria bacterium]|nr:flagellar export chaperone FliS [Deltaproteobacteria bacterium]MCL4872511.1 flagellar export chaperone FliS [bacterium]